MSIESITTSIPENRQGKVRSWSEMSSYLNNSLESGCKKFLRSYFRTQLFIVGGRKNKAIRLFGYLDKITGYTEFERNHKKHFVAIDIAVRGETKRY